MADLKEIIRESLGVKSVTDLGATGGGCISNSRRFQTENGNVFVKTYEQEKVTWKVKLKWERANCLFGPKTE